MESKKVREPKKADDVVSVKAAEGFRHRRLITIDGLSVEEYRSLQIGLTITITRSLFDRYPECFEKVEDKDGDRIL